MKRFWKFVRHLLYVLWLLPMLLILGFCTYGETQSVVVESCTVLQSLTITEADGSEYRETYDYNPGYTEATVSFYENGELVRTEVRTVTEADHRSEFEIFDHPTATAASSEKEADGSYATVRWYDAEGNPEGWSELTYDYNHMLARQIDYAADGTLLRTTIMDTLTWNHKALPTSPTEEKATGSHKGCRF